MWEEVHGFAGVWDGVLMTLGLVCCTDEFRVPLLCAFTPSRFRFLLQFLTICSPASSFPAVHSRPGSLSTLPPDLPSSSKLSTLSLLCLNRLLFLEQLSSRHSTFCPTAVSDTLRRTRSAEGATRDRSTDRRSQSAADRPTRLSRVQGLTWRAF